MDSFRQFECPYIFLVQQKPFRKDFQLQEMKVTAIKGRTILIKENSWKTLIIAK